MPWILHQTEFEDDLLTLKISSQEEIDMKSATEVDTKGVYPEDTFNRMDKGKSLPVIIAEKSDTSHETADNQSTTITLRMQDHHVPDRCTPTKITTTLLEA
jgi:hypothetical protein